MKHEAMEITRQETAASITTETDTTVNDAKCPFAENGPKIHKNTDTNTVMGVAATSETNGVATISTPPANDKPIGLGSFKVAKIETVKENLEAQSLTVQQINDYCKSLFIFKNIRVMRFK